MSKEFSEIKISYDSDMKKQMKEGPEATGEVTMVLCKRNDKPENLNKAIVRDFVLGVPYEDGMKYVPTFVECTVNLLTRLTQELEKGEKGGQWEKPPAERLSRDDIPVEFRHQIDYVAQTLQYMINCYSWREKAGYKAFDAIEIKNRLERAAAMSNIALRD